MRLCIHLLYFGYLTDPKSLKQDRMTGIGIVCRPNLKCQ